MEGGLWRPYQVVGVLAAVLSTALISLQFTPSDERAGARLIPDKPNLGTLGERLNANTIAIVAGDPNATYLTIAHDMSDWPKDSDRYRRIANFVDVFFPKLAQLQQPPHHPKWRETNLAAVVPSWTRFPAAADWLERQKQSAIAGARSSAEEPAATGRPRDPRGHPENQAAHDQPFPGVRQLASASALAIGEN